METKTVQSWSTDKGADVEKEKTGCLNVSICLTFIIMKMLGTTLCQWIWKCKIGNHLKTYKVKIGSRRKWKPEFVCNFKSKTWIYSQKKGIRAQWFYSELLLK